MLKATRGGSGGVNNNYLPVHQPQQRPKSVHDMYKTLEILGQGTYGVVYKAENRATGGLVAMKRCRLDAFRDFGIPETTLREIALLKDLRHENIMDLHHVSCNTERLYLISEYLDYDLKKYLRATQSNGLSVQQVKKLTFGILNGLAYCHGHRVIHRDLKPHNVLVSTDASKIRIADFGLARSAVAPGKTLTHEVITLWYRAPELLLGHCNYTSGVDIWSVGCILAELLSSRPLYVGDSEIDTLFRILRLLGSPAESDWPEHSVVPWAEFPKFAGKPDRFKSLHPDLDAHGIDLLESMFRFNSAKRITALEAMHHPWFADIREAMQNIGKPVMIAEVDEWRLKYPPSAFHHYGGPQKPLDTVVTLSTSSLLDTSTAASTPMPSSQTTNSTREFRQTYTGHGRVNEDLDEDLNDDSESIQEGCGKAARGEATAETTGAISQRKSGPSLGTARLPTTASKAVADSWDVLGKIRRTSLTSLIGDRRRKKSGDPQTAVGGAGSNIALQSEKSICTDTS